jgi:alkylation response protein AidB-like acyl-CoA dehydrogenase
MNATHCMVLARTDPTAAKHRGITAFLVPLDSAGITRRPIKQINGEVDFAEVFYDEVRVSAASVLGTVHDGWRVTMTTLGYERAGVLAMAAQLAGDAEAPVREVAAAEQLARSRTSADHGSALSDSPASRDRRRGPNVAGRVCFRRARTTTTGQVHGRSARDRTSICRSLHF